MNAETVKKNTFLLIENYADNIHYSSNDVFIALDQYHSDKCGKTISDTQLSYVNKSVWVPVRRFILQIIYFVCFISRMLDSNNLIQIIRDTHCFW
jgi:hypothetical protein